MPRYISLLKFTEKGAQGVKQSTERAHKFAEVAKKAGAKIEAQYWTVGRFDGVLVLSAAHAEQALRCVAELAAAGYVRPQTLQAFTDQEFDGVLKS
jgi:uncharacterized protein with GYD domain